MSNALTVYTPQDLAQSQEVAEMLAHSGLVPDALKGKPSAVWAILALGAELGLTGPMGALSGIHVISGRPSPSPQTMLALCLRHPACEFFTFLSKESDDNSASWIAKRRGSDPVPLTFTIEEARRLNYTSKDQWRKQPNVMLRWRAMAALARLVFPDVTMGLYTTDEVADFDAPRAPAEPRVETRPAVRPRTEAAAATVARRTEALRHGTSTPPAAVAEDAEVVDVPRGVDALRVALRSVGLTLDEYDTWAAHVAGKISATIDAAAAEKMAEWVTRGTNADRVRSKLAEMQAELRAPKQAKASEPHAPRAGELHAALADNGINADCAADYALARGIKAATDNGARALWLAIMEPQDDDFAAFMAEWDRAHPEAAGLIGPGAGESPNW
jgi:hypothetical protein